MTILSSFSVGAVAPRGTDAASVQVLGSSDPYPLHDGNAEPAKVDIAVFCVFAVAEVRSVESPFLAAQLIVDIETAL